MNWKLNYNIQYSPPVLLSSNSSGVSVLLQVPLLYVIAYHLAYICALAFPLLLLVAWWAWDADVFQVYEDVVQVYVEVSDVDLCRLFLAAASLATFSAAAWGWQFWLVLAGASRYVEVNVINVFVDWLALGRVVVFAALVLGLQIYWFWTEVYFWPDLLAEVILIWKCCVWPRIF